MGVVDDKPSLCVSDHGQTTGKHLKPFLPPTPYQPPIPFFPLTKSSAACPSSYPDRSLCMCGASARTAFTGGKGHAIRDHYPQAASSKFRLQKSIGKAQGRKEKEKSGILRRKQFLRIPKPRSTEASRGKRWVEGRAEFILEDLEATCSGARPPSPLITALPQPTNTSHFPWALGLVGRRPLKHKILVPTHHSHSVIWSN